MNYYHFKAGHNNYHVLYEKIIDKDYYWNNFNKSCILYIKNCKIFELIIKMIFAPNVIGFYAINQKNFMKWI